MTSDFEAQLHKMKTQPGFIAALDQSGGSTPGALRAYGIKDDAWSTEEEMFALVHQTRTRLMTSPVFTGARILGAILFENTMDRAVEGQPTADYLWNVKQIVPFLKVDKGLATEKAGVQLMKPMPELAALLDRANAKHIFGTKMRSVIKQADAAAIKDVVRQQFDVARQIIATGLVPIVEPEVDIHCPAKAQAEELLKAEVLEKLDGLTRDQLVMLKLTLPEKADLYAECVKHPNVVRVVALSAGTRARKPTSACGAITASWRATRARSSRDCRRSSPMPSTTRRWTRPSRASSRRPPPEQSGRRNPIVGPTETRKGRKLDEGTRFGGLSGYRVRRPRGRAGQRQSGGRVVHAR